MRFVLAVVIGCSLLFVAPAASVQADYGPGEMEMPVVVVPIAPSGGPAATTTTLGPTSPGGSVATTAPAPAPSAATTTPQGSVPRPTGTGSGGADGASEPGDVDAVGAEPAPGDVDAVGAEQAPGDAEPADTPAHGSLPQTGRDLVIVMRLAMAALAFGVLAISAKQRHERNPRRHRPQHAEPRFRRPRWLRSLP